MKVFALALTVLPLLALANPIAEAEAEAEPELEALEKRAVTCTLTGCDVRYRRSPSTSAIADGQYSGCNDKVVFSCFTTGTSVNGDVYWDRIASGAGKGDYMSEYYVDSKCAAQLPPC